MGWNMLVYSRVYISPDFDILSTSLNMCLLQCPYGGAYLWGEEGGARAELTLNPIKGLHNVFLHTMGPQWV